MCVLLGVFREFPVDPYYEPLAWFMIITVNYAIIFILLYIAVNYAGFLQSVYIIEEDDTSFMPMMVLDVPSPCCITIRAELVNYNSTGGFFI